MTDDPLHHESDSHVMEFRDRLREIPSEARPRHIAVIMDGNGRWAQARGLPRLAGHKEGAGSVRMLIEELARLELDAVTLYSFSSENWKRPPEEVEGLMALCHEHLLSERDLMLRNQIRFRRIGSTEGLPENVLEQLEATEQATAGCQGLQLNLALNYGSRQEIVDATRRISEKVRQGHLDPADIDQEVLSSHLWTAGIPDPDLLIRTAGEMRLSNYLLWQISYAELFVTDVLWPDFTIEHLHQAFCAYAGRKRKYGGLQAEDPASTGDPTTP